MQNKDKGKSAGKGGKSKQPCHYFAKGKCTRKNCPFSHETQSNQRATEQPAQVSPPAAVAPQAAPAPAPAASPGTGESVSARLIDASSGQAEEIRLVYMRPTRTDDTLVVQRRFNSEETILPFSNMLRGKLPLIDKPPPSYCFQSTLYPSNFPDIRVQVVWDGGAEHLSISGRCASRIMKAQNRSSLPGAQLPLVDVKEMSPTMKFGGFVKLEKTP